VLDGARQRGVLADVQPRGVLAGYDPLGAAAQAGWGIDPFEVEARNLAEDGDDIGALEAAIARSHDLGASRVRGVGLDFTFDPTAAADAFPPPNWEIMPPPRSWGQRFWEDYLSTLPYHQTIGQVVGLRDDIQAAGDIDERGDGNWLADVGDGTWLAATLLPGVGPGLRKLRLATHLPMDEASRAARATAQHYPEEVLYHGGVGGLEGFDRSMRGRSTNAVTARSAFWATPDPPVADKYARHTAERLGAGDPAVYPLRVRTESPGRIEYNIGRGRGPSEMEVAMTFKRLGTAATILSALFYTTRTAHQPERWLSETKASFVRRSPTSIRQSKPVTICSHLTALPPCSVAASLPVQA